MRVLSKIKDAYKNPRNPKEQTFLKENLERLENQQTKQALISFFIKQIPQQIYSPKKCTPYDFIRIMTTYKEGLPEMSDRLKNLLQSITPFELEKEFKDTYAK